MKKDKDFVEAEIVNERKDSKSKKAKSSAGFDFAQDGAREQIKAMKKALLFKGGFYLAGILVVFLLIISAFLALLFWILPFIIFALIAIFILGFFINLGIKIYSLFKG